MSDRERWFREFHDAIRDWYLAAPDNPYRMSGRTSGAMRWEETRRCIAEAIDRDGAFLDVGCANGLLLQTLRRWSPFQIEPFGIDFVEELIPYARARHPKFAANFHVANVWDWEPGRRFEFVRTNLEYVPALDWPEYLRRVASYADRLIVCHYHNADEDPLPVAAVMEECGLDVAASVATPGNVLAWTTRSGSSRG